MKTNVHKILMYSFIFSLVTVLPASLMKIYHIDGGSTLLGIGLIATFVYMVTALYEIFNSRRINTPEKLMWLIGFLFFNLIAGLLYVFSARRRIVVS
ncbi:MAG: PLDc N-terminal domain-containing protein [Flavobacterium sp.]|nr:PLDc N-terminal domain-containing protein [Flavobacterium sp.]